MNIYKAVPTEKTQVGFISKMSHYTFLHRVYTSGVKTYTLFKK